MSSGTKPSGAEYKRRRRAQEEAERQGASTLSGIDPAARPDLDAYRKLGPPPKGTIGVIAWANRIGGLLLHEVVTDPTIDARERRRVGRELIAAIGQTHSKARAEEMQRAIAKRVGAAPETDDDLDEFPGDIAPRK